MGGWLIVSGTFCQAERRCWTGGVGNPKRGCMCWRGCGDGGTGAGGGVGEVEGSGPGLAAATPDQVE